MAGWDSNWATSQGVGKTYYNVFHQLREALAERHRETATPPALPAAVPPGAVLHPAWFAAFQTAITGIIPKWVDHTQYSGDYSGRPYNGADTIPLWSVASMLTAIGAPSRLAAPTSGQIPRAAWAYQQYLILNKLRWGRGRYYDFTQGTNYRRDGRAATFAGAVAAMNAAAWSAGRLPLAGSGVNMNFGHVCEYYSGGAMVQVGRARTDHSSATWGGLTNCQVDGYIIGRYGPGTPGQPAFYNADNGLVYNQLFKIVADGAPNATFQIGGYGNATVTDLVGRQGWGSLATMEWFPVCKFDVSGGFDYL